MCINNAGDSARVGGWGWEEQVVGSDKQPPSPWQPAPRPPPLPRQQLPGAHRGYPPSPLGHGSAPAAGAQRGPPRPLVPDQKRAKPATRLWQRMRRGEKLSDPDSEGSATEREIEPESSSRGYYSPVQEVEKEEKEEEAVEGASPTGSRLSSHRSHTDYLCLEEKIRRDMTDVSLIKRSLWRRHRECCHFNSGSAFL